MGYTAIFGGTFNPPHIGHYEMLEELQSLPYVEEIFITPTRIPPHKQCDFLAEQSDRTEMCRLLCSDFSKARLCLEEFNRTGKSYTYDTVTLLKEKYPEKQFAFVCGGDMLTTFDTWYRYEELMLMLPFLVFRRADIEDSLFDEKTEKFRKKGMQITVIDRKITAVASTFIRNNLENSRELLPRKISDYIDKEGIYGVRK